VGECFFWYWLTQVVPDKARELKNGCSTGCVKSFQSTLERRAFLVFGAQTSRKAVREANLAENSRIIN